LTLETAVNFVDKGRFLVFKAGIRLHGVEMADKMMWLTCCALHIWFLEIDGLDQPWDGSLGQFNEEDCRLPTALERLNSPARARRYDSAGNGHGDDVDDSVLELVTEEKAGDEGPSVEQSEDE
jgi:hypothetical protein